MITALRTMLGVALLAGPAHAGGACGSVCSSRVSYPSRSYSTGYYNSYQPLQKIVAYQAPVSVTSYGVPVYYPQSYYEVGAEYKLRNVVAAVVQELQLQPQEDIQTERVERSPAQYKQQVRREIEDQGGEPPANPTPTCNCGNACKCYAPNGNGGNGGNPPNPPGDGGHNDESDGASTQEVLRVFTSTAGGRKACVECHGSTQKLGGQLRLVVPEENHYRLAFVPIPKRYKCYIKTQKGQMPPSVLAGAEPNMDHALSQDELDVLLAWAEEE